MKIRLTAPPVEGQANSQLIEFLAKQFKVPKSQVQLLSGEQARQKRYKYKHRVYCPLFWQSRNTANPALCISLLPRHQQ